MNSTRAASVNASSASCDIANKYLAKSQNMMPSINLALKIFTNENVSCLEAENKVYQLENQEMLERFTNYATAEKKSYAEMIQYPEKWVQRFSPPEPVMPVLPVEKSLLEQEIPGNYVLLLLAVSALWAFRRPLASLIKFWCKPKVATDEYQPMVIVDDLERAEVVSPGVRYA